MCRHLRYFGILIIRFRSKEARNRREEILNRHAITPSTPINERSLGYVSVKPSTLQKKKEGCLVR